MQKLNLARAQSFHYIVFSKNTLRTTNIAGSPPSEVVTFSLFLVGFLEFDFQSIFQKSYQIQTVRSSCADLRKKNVLKYQVHFTLLIVVVGDDGDDDDELPVEQIINKIITKSQQDIYKTTHCLRITCIYSIM